MAELSDEAYERIKALCKKGDDLAEIDDFSAALDQYWAAWTCCPSRRPIGKPRPGFWVRSVMCALGRPGALLPDLLSGITGPWVSSTRRLRRHGGRRDHLRHESI